MVNDAFIGCSRMVTRLLSSSLGPFRQFISRTIRIVEKAKKMLSSCELINKLDNSGPTYASTTAKAAAAAHVGYGGLSNACLKFFPFGKTMRTNKQIQIQKRRISIVSRVQVAIWTFPGRSTGRRYLRRGGMMMSMVRIVRMTA